MRHVGAGVEVVVVQKGNLELVPGALVLQYVVRLQFLEERVGDGVIIGAAQVVQVGITNDFFEEVVGRLRNLGGHDHAFDLVYVRLCVSEIGEDGLHNPAAFGLVTGVNIGDKTGIVEQCRCFDQKDFSAENPFAVAQHSSHAQYIEGVMQPVVVQLPGQFLAQAVYDVLFGSAIIHVTTFGMQVKAPIMDDGFIRRSFAF